MLLVGNRPDRAEEIIRVREGVLRKTKVPLGEIVSLVALQDVEGVMPLIDYGDDWYEMPEYPLCLEDKLKLTNKEIWKILASVYDTIRAINDRGWVHCDITVWNIWMGLDLHPVLGDFGQCYHSPSSRDPTADPADCDIRGIWGAKAPKLSFRGILQWIERWYDMTFKDDQPELVALEAKMRAGLPDDFPVSSYQKMTWPGGYEICGTRDCEARWKIMSRDVTAIMDRTVLDLGCNYGWFTFQSAQSGAKLSVGLDSISKYIRCALEMSKLFNVPRAAFCAFDLDKLTLDELQRVTGRRYFDVVYCLSIWHHIHDKDSFMSALRDIAKERIYFEMTRKNDPIHRPKTNHSEWGTEEWWTYLEYELPSFKVVHLGMVGDLMRPIFEARRK